METSSKKLALWSFHHFPRLLMKKYFHFFLFLPTHGKKLQKKKMKWKIRNCVARPGFEPVSNMRVNSKYLSHKALTYWKHLVLPIKSLSKTCLPCLYVYIYNSTRNRSWAKFTWIERERFTICVRREIHGWHFPFFSWFWVKNLQMCVLFLVKSLKLRESGMNRISQPKIKMKSEFMKC